MAGAAVREAVSGLEDALWKSGVTILIENTAGQCGQIGRSFEEVRDIIACSGDLPLGMCLDTAHSFAAGYDWRSPRRASQAMNLQRDSRLSESRPSISTIQSQHSAHRWTVTGTSERSHQFRRSPPVINHPRLRGLRLILETPDDSIRRDADNLAIARSLGAI